MMIIPAIDIIEGKCVRLVKGDYAQQTIYSDDPLEVAMQFEDAGISRLHLVDLDGARAGKVKNWKVLERIAKHTNLVIDFSGGISSQKQLNTAIDAGAKYISIGTMAVKREIVFYGWMIAYGADKFIIGADVREEKVVIRGWTEQASITALTLIEKYKTKGAKQFFCTDINKDGLLQGPCLDLYKKILNKHPSINLIASGGVSTIQDLYDLQEAGCSGVIIGKAIYENKITLKELSNFR